MKALPKTNDFRGTRRYLSSLIACLLAIGSQASADVGRGGLDEEREFTDEGVDYLITYSDTAGDSDRVTTADVDNLEDFAKTSYDRLVDVMGFRAPWLSTLPDYEFIVKDDWWFAEPACVVLDAPSIRAWSEDSSKVVFFHERFHTVQRNYKDSINGGGSGYIGSTFGKLVSEGTADAIMDKGYADLDDKTGYPYYEGSASNFLQSWVDSDGVQQDGPMQSLFDKDYDGCLWWNYLMEQLGTNKVEPHYGTEFMKSFWNLLVTNGDTGAANSKLTMEQLISSRGRTLEGMFHDFTICNYARQYDTAGLLDGAKYRYVDEQTQAITVNVELQTASISASGSNAVNSWATNYIEAVVDGGDECFAVGFKAESRGDTMAFAAVAVTRTGKVVGIRKGIGTEFAAVFFSEPGQPIERICGIVAALEEGETADWEFDSGTPLINIVRPTFTRPAYPGVFDDPGNIVVTTKVTGLPGLAPAGPNNPSILGLEEEYFEVTIGAVNAPVLDAAYVGGFWELLVAAPVQAADGFYDVTVNLCPGIQGGVSDNVKNGVLYGDLVFHHAVVLDISGSMVYPSDAKLRAAKQAARFYIDTIGNQDKFTVISFSGNGSECDEDASNLKGAPGLLNGTGLSRGLMKGVVNALTAQDLTSIGDGLWTAQDALDVDASPDAIDTILLLTDGKENESRYWASNPDGCGRVDTRILGAETIVNTRAFGEDAETDLCQAIAATTTGDYLFNPVDEGASPARKSATSDFGSHNNRLSLQFFAGLEHAKQLQRIILERKNLAANGDFESPLAQPYDKVSKPLIYVGWSEATTVVVEIETPDGSDLAADSVVYVDDTHVVFHPNNPLIKGEYIVRAQEKDGKAVEVFCGISGKPGNSLDFRCSLSPVLVGGILGRQEHPYERFERGMPVDINLAAFDLLGPILNLNVSVEVTMPDGSPACPKALAMLDDAAHQDGDFEDGRYGVRFGRTPFGSSYVFGKGDRDEKAESPVGSSGTYRVVITAQGKDNFGNRVARTFEKAFQVYQRAEFGNGNGDTDGDEMPDSWEVFYGTNPNIKDAGEDKDFDGLTNLEEFWAGTNPCDPDTDNGGAADGYEVANNLCPLCPLDDPFPNLANVSIITTSDSHGDVRTLKPKALLLQFPDDPNYGRMEVYRGLATGFPCNAAHLLDVLDMGGVENLVTSFYDEGLTDGVRYFYKFRALSVDGQVGTPFSREVTGIARNDPAEPFGSIVLNSKQDKSDRLKLAVKLLPRGNGVDYRLSSESFNGPEPWSPLPPFGTAVVFPLPASLGDGDMGRVYFQFRSSAGMTSRTYNCDIRLDFSGDNDNDFSPDAVDPDDDNDGLSDDDELFLYCTNPYEADTDGDGYSDKEEIDEGSDPTDVDSVPDGDNDGDSDRLEGLLGSDKNDPNSIPDIGLLIVENGGMAELSFNTGVGVLYRVHNRSNLESRVRDWNKLLGPLAGDGTRMEFILPIDVDRKFFGVSFELAPLP